MAALHHLCGRAETPKAENKVGTQEIQEELRENDQNSEDSNEEKMEFEHLMALEGISALDEAEAEELERLQEFVVDKESMIAVLQLIKKKGKGEQVPKEKAVISPRSLAEDSPRPSLDSLTSSRRGFLEKTVEDLHKELKKLKLKDLERDQKEKDQPSSMDHSFGLNLSRLKGGHKEDSSTLNKLLVSYCSQDPVNALKSPFLPRATTQPILGGFTPSDPVKGMALGPLRPIWYAGQGTKFEELKKGMRGLATPNLKCDVPTFDGKDLQEYGKEVARFLRVTANTGMSDQQKADLIMMGCKETNIRKLVEQEMEEATTFVEFLEKLEALYPSFETDASIRNKLDHVALLPNDPSITKIKQLTDTIESLVRKLTPGTYSGAEQLMLLMSKIQTEQWNELQATKEDRSRCHCYKDLKTLMIEQANDKLSRRHVEEMRVKVMERKRGTQPQKHGKPDKELKTMETIEPTADPDELAFVQSNSKGKGKGKGKAGGKGQGDQGKGRGDAKNGSKPERDDPDQAKYDKFTATITCKHCSKTGHYADWCFQRIKSARQELKKKLKEDPNSVSPTQAPSAGRPPPVPTPPSRPTPTPVLDPPAVDDSNSKKRKLNLTKALRLIKKEGYSEPDPPKRK
jgi:hypothetical protein